MSQDRASSGSLVPVGPANPGDGDHDHVDTITRFQSLEPGYYWTAVKAVDRVAHVGDTLLLIEITEALGKVHSVNLAVHPRDGEGQYTLHVDAFLDAFVPCPDGEAIRTREQQAVMTKVAELQQELVTTQSDPRLMIEAVRDTVEKEIKEQEKTVAQERESEIKSASERERDLRQLHRRAARRSEAKGNPLVAPRAALASDVGRLIDAGINESGVEEMRKIAIQQGAIATAQAKWLEVKTGEITATLKTLTPYIKERAMVALARSSGAIAMAKRIKRGIESLDLYTGTGVDVFDIRTGAPALSSEPLTLIQGKRYMDEELAVWADVSCASFDWRSRERFFEAIADNDALLQQVLPAPRCVVTMAVTRHQRDYCSMHPYEAMMNNLQNQLVFLLVRNGDNVHVVYSTTPSHEASARLFPTQDELGGHFQGFDGRQMSVKDIEFGKASQRFGDTALHYKRFLILLCGLDHRLQLFGGFYPPEQQMQFMSLDFQERYFRFVCDDEPNTLIGDQLPTMSSWIDERNKAAQSGSRIFLLRDANLRANAPELARRTSLRATEEQFKSPFIAQKEAKQLYVSLKTKDRGYGIVNDAPIVKCYLNEPEAATDAWWLCVDAADLADVRAYRFSRYHRSMGIEYLRLFRRIEAFLEEEALQEAASRAYLLDSAVTHGGMDAKTAKAALDVAVRNWRASRRGAPLPEVDDKKALHEVLALMVPEGQLPGSVSAMLDAWLDAKGIRALLVTRTGKSKIVVYAEASDDDKAPYPDILTWGWVKRFVLEAGKTKMLEGSSSLVWLGKVLPASEVEVRRTPELEPWLHELGEPMPLRRYAQVLPALANAKAWETALQGGKDAGIDGDLFEALRTNLATVYRNSKSRYVEHVIVAIPIAAYSRDGRKLFIAYACEHAERVLCHYGNAEQAEQVRARYIGRYANKDVARRRLEEAVNWRIWQSEVNDIVVPRHDDMHVGTLAGVSGSPKWLSHACQVNSKHFRTSKGDGRPCTRDSESTLSPSRGLVELTGVSPSIMRRSFYASMERRAKDKLRWAWRSEDTSTAEAKALRKERFVLPYKSAVSPLFWPEGAKAPTANWLLVGALRRDKLAGAAKDAGAEEAAC